MLHPGHFLTYIKPMLYTHRNQSIDLQCNIGEIFVKYSHESKEIFRSCGNINWIWSNCLKRKKRKKRTGEHNIKKKKAKREKEQKNKNKRTIQ